MSEKLNAYKATSVNWAKSQAQIGKLLDKAGIQDVRFTFMQSQAILKRPTRDYLV